jgi:hypothetical protein
MPNCVAHVATPCGVSVTMATNSFLNKEGGIYFAVPDKKLGPVSGMTFRRDYVESGWDNDYRAVGFEKMLN